MLTTIRAIVRDGKIELLEPLSIAEGTPVLVTVFSEEEQAFWQDASGAAAAKIWGSDEDDIYAELLTS